MGSLVHVSERRSVTFGYTWWMLPRIHHATLVLLAALAACQGQGSSTTAGEPGTTTTSSSSSSSTTTSTSTTTGTTTSPTTTGTTTTSPTSSSGTSSTTGDAVPCQVEVNNCPKGQVCCQFDFLDPPTCEVLRPGQCGDDSDCEEGFACGPGGIECPIGSCEPIETSSTGTPGTGGSSGASSTG